MTSTGPLQNAARDTFLYALPLTEIANVRSRLLGAGLPAGRFFLQKGLATPADRFVTTPNAGDALSPVDGFWSLTLYELEPKGAMFLTSNSINRYTIGDRTPGLARDNSGGLEIWISRGDPGAGRSANWLPAPAQGPFVLILRTYLPRAALIWQRYVPPSVEKL